MKNKYVETAGLKPPYCIRRTRWSNMKMIYLNMVLYLVFSSCTNERGKTNIEPSEKETIIVTESPEFVFEGSYNNWFEIKNDLYFRVTFKNSSSEIEMTNKYFLSKRNDWLLLVTRCAVNSKHV
jgi:hypothetical protein